VATSAGGIVGVGTGHSSLCDKARRLVAGLGGATFSDAIARLPAQLRQACAETRAHCRVIGAHYQVAFALGLVGFADGGARGAVLAETDGFEPVATPAWLSPHVAGLPTTAEDVLRVAQNQLRIVRGFYPGATGKTLCLVRVGRTGIATRSVPLMIGEWAA
jgi:hypothetical protein